MNRINVLIAQALTMEQEIAAAITNGRNLATVYRGVPRVLGESSRQQQKRRQRQLRQIRALGIVGRYRCIATLPKTQFSHWYNRMRTLMNQFHVLEDRIHRAQVTARFG